MQDYRKEVEKIMRSTVGLTRENEAVFYMLGMINDSLQEIARELRAHREDREDQARETEKLFTLWVGLPDNPEPYNTYATIQEAQADKDRLFSGRDDVGITEHELARDTRED